MVKMVLVLELIRHLLDLSSLLLIVNKLGSWTLWFVRLLVLILLEIAECGDHGRVRAHLWLRYGSHDR